MNKALSTFFITVLCGFNAFAQPKAVVIEDQKTVNSVCTNIDGLSKSYALSVAEKEKVAVSSLSVVGDGKGHTTGNCFIQVDTPNGPTPCLVNSVVKKNNGKYFATITIGGVLCGGMATW